mgnify:FL=1
MSFRIDIGQPQPFQYGTDELIGGGITNALYWRSTARMDRAGTIEFAIPAADEKAVLVQPLYVARCWALLGGTWQQIAAGVIERIERQIDQAGNVLIVASGPDLLGELSARLPSFSLSWINSGAGITLTSACSFLNTASGNWQFSVVGTPPVNTVYGDFSLDPVLSTLIAMARRTYTHFYPVPGARSVVFTPDWTASGVRAVRPGGDLVAETCAITSLRQIDDAADVVSEIYPFGGGNAEARLTIQATTRTPPTGYVVQDTAIGYRIYSQAAELIYGSKVRSAVRQWKDITPLSSTEADMQTAANALYDEALLWLQQHEEPQQFYQVDIAGASAILRPMQTIRVTYRDTDQGFDIDEDLYILEATTEANADGVATVGLTISTVDRYPDSDVGEVVGRLTQAQIYATQPQFNANSYVLPFTKTVDQTETANFRFRFDTEVWQINRVTFDFQLLPMESTVKTVASNSATSSAGGATTSSSGGGQTKTSTSGGGQTKTSSSGGATTSSGGSTHSHSVSNHQHEVPLSADADPTGNHPFARIVYYDPTDDNLYFSAASGSGYSTSSASGGGQTSSSESTHTHTIGNHDHSVTVDAHTHDVTVDAHTHDIGNHTHTVTPTITTTYGIYRDSAGNTFAVTDLEYSLDGSTWYNFTVGVNGYTTLGDGWTRVDLTALLQDSTTLRPLNANNMLRIRRKSTGAAGKMATIDAQMNVRSIIQAVSLS